MDGVQAWSDGYSADRTVFLWSENENTRNVVNAICKSHDFNLYDATESESSIIDWLAVPFFICVADRSLYIAHQDEIVEYHKMEVNDSVEIVLGDGPLSNQDPSYFVQMPAPDFQTMDQVIIREKKRFDRQTLVGCLELHHQS